MRRSLIVGLFCLAVTAAQAQLTLVGVGPGGASVAAPSTTWNPADKHADITLTNGNLTAELSSGSGEGRNFRSTTSHTTGRYGFTITVNEDAGLGGAESIGIGLCNASYPIGNTATFIGEEANSMGMWDTSNIYYDYNGGGGMVPYGSGGTTFDETGNNQVNVLVDLTTREWWVKNNTESNWNQSAGANPVTGVGGLALGSNLATGALYICAELDNATQKITLDPTGAGLPSGYTGGW